LPDTQTGLEKGSNLAEMTEAVHVVTAIRGGSSLVYGIQIRKIAEFSFTKCCMNLLDIFVYSL
jgi:hypothetical protein